MTMTRVNEEYSYLIASFLTQYGSVSPVSGVKDICRINDAAVI